MRALIYKEGDSTGSYRPSPLAIQLLQLAMHCVSTGSVAQVNIRECRPEVFCVEVHSRTGGRLDEKEVLALMHYIAGSNVFYTLLRLDRCNKKWEHHTEIYVRACDSEAEVAK